MSECVSDGEKEAVRSQVCPFVHCMCCPQISPGPELRPEGHCDVPPLDLRVSPFAPSAKHAIAHFQLLRSAKRICRVLKASRMARIEAGPDRAVPIHTREEVRASAGTPIWRDLRYCAVTPGLVRGSLQPLSHSLSTSLVSRLSVSNGSSCSSFDHSHEGTAC